MLSKLTYDQIFQKEYRVCCKHFAKGSWFGGALKPRLKESAIPTLLLADIAFNESVEEGIDVQHADSDEIKLKNLLPKEISPSIKYFRSSGACEIRSSLDSPETLRTSINKIVVENSIESQMQITPTQEVSVITPQEYIPNSPSVEEIPSNSQTTNMIMNKNLSQNLFQIRARRRKQSLKKNDQFD